jgi:hypothetical protein
MIGCRNVWIIRKLQLDSANHAGGIQRVLGELADKSVINENLQLKESIMEIAVAFGVPNEYEEDEFRNFYAIKHLKQLRKKVSNRTRLIETVSVAHGKVSHKTAEKFREIQKKFPQS